MPIPIGIALAVANLASKWFQGNAQEKAAQQYHSKMVGLASNLFNGRMAGAADLEKGILSSEGNQLDVLKNNATDSSQLIAGAAGIGGATDQSLSDLQTKEAQSKYQMFDRLNEAYGNELKTKSDLYGSGANNKYGAISDLSSLFLLGKQLGWMGGNSSGGGGADTGGTFSPTAAQYYNRKIYK